MKIPVEMTDALYTNFLSALITCCYFVLSFLFGVFLGLKYKTQILNLCFGSAESKLTEFEFSSSVVKFEKSVGREDTIRYALIFLRNSGAAIGTQELYSALSKELQIQSVLICEGSQDEDFSYAIGISWIQLYEHSSKSKQLLVSLFSGLGDLEIGLKKGFGPISIFFYQREFVAFGNISRKRVIELAEIVKARKSMGTTRALISKKGWIRGGSFFKPGRNFLTSGYLKRTLFYLCFSQTILSLSFYLIGIAPAFWSHMYTSIHAFLFPTEEVLSPIPEDNSEKKNLTPLFLGIYFGIMALVLFWGNEK